MQRIWADCREVGGDETKRKQQKEQKKKKEKGGEKVKVRWRKKERCGLRTTEVTLISLILEVGDKAAPGHSSSS